MMTLEALTTVDQVVERLGGNAAVARLTGRKGTQAVSNWRAEQSFPPSTYLLLKSELHARGCTAPDSLWRMMPPTAERSA